MSTHRVPEPFFNYMKYIECLVLIDMEKKAETPSFDRIVSLQSQAGEFRAKLERALSDPKDRRFPIESGAVSEAGRQVVADYLGHMASVIESLRESIMKNVEANDTTWMENNRLAVRTAARNLINGYSEIEDRVATATMVHDNLHEWLGLLLTPEQVEKSKREAVEVIEMVASEQYALEALS